MKNNYLIVLLLSIFLISFCVPNVSAFFTRDHLIFTIDGFEQVDSPITQQCRPYLDIVLDGNTGNDVPVLHYGDSKVTSYIFTHIINGYNTCLQEAGSDIQMRCFCYGGYLHNMQDHLSHLKGGLVEVNLRKYVGNNYFGHMSIEKDFENKHVELKTSESDYAITSGKLDYYDSIVLNNLFVDGQPSKYLQLLDKMSGIDLTNDAAIFKNAYQGEGFYNTVYKDKIQLPWWFNVIAFGMIFFGLGMALFVFFIGKTGWKWLTILIWLGVAIIGIILVISFFNGSSWKLATVLIEVPPMFGYFSSTDAQVAYYDGMAQTATNNFLKTGNPTIIDASGLSYCKVTNTDGSCKERVQGPLTQAELPFKIIFYVLFLPLLIIVQVWLLYKSLVPKRSK